MNQLLENKWLRPVLWCCLVIFSVLIIRYGVAPAFNNTRGDFANYYTAARLTLEGTSFERAYRDFTWFQKQMDRFGIQNQVGGFIPHPPSTALIFLPIAWLPPVTAKNVWTALNVILVLVNVILLSRIAGLHWLITACLFLGTGYGLINHFLFGQQYLLLTLTILTGIYCYQKSRMAFAGIAFGLMVPVKYFGILFIAYAAWRRQWRVVLFGLGTIIGVSAVTVLFCGTEVFTTFITEVLPRHLRGEIQDPFSVYFQSFNSLFRRLFIFEQTLNASPAVDSVVLFVILKNIIFWLLLGFLLYFFVNTEEPNAKSQLLFHFGLIPAGLLLLSPANTTYYFILLSISTVIFFKLFLDKDKSMAALLIGFLFIIINLPHFMKLKMFAIGWLTPVAYLRLWLLFIFVGCVIWFFRQTISWYKLRSLKFWMPVLTLASLASTLEYNQAAATSQDGARWLEICEPQFQRHHGLLLKSPDVGHNKIVFSYCELLDDNYAIYSTDGKPLTPRSTPNFYEPDLASDDTSLVMETMVDGKPQIRFSKAGFRDPLYLTDGEDPSWHPNMEAIAFVRDGRVYILNLATRQEYLLSTTGRCYDVSFSEDGKKLLYCAQQENGSNLLLYDIHSNEEKIILNSSERIDSPCWAVDDTFVLFSWNVSQNRDIWVYRIATKELKRLTTNFAADTSPVWDKARRRIIFCSDRGRGLEFSTLYWLPFPARDASSTIMY